MSATQTTAAPRRSQVERSEAMKVRLLEATLELISEQGWSGTSTAKICEKAGVSRGAQTHHYRTKAELLIAAVRKSTASFDQTVIADFPDPTSELSPVRQYLKLLWQACLDRAFFECWIEAMVAARTDTELRAAITEVDKTAISAMRSFSSNTIPEDQSASLAADLVELSAYLLRGMAIQRSVHQDEAARLRLYEKWCDIVEGQLEQ